VRTKIEPLSATRYTLQVTLSGTAHDKLRRLQDLLAHSVPDVAGVIERSFDACLEKLERQKFGIGAKAGTKRGAPTVRSIPAQIRKAVHDRDGGQCAHRYENGRRCPNKAKLEFDHIVPVAKGGRTTIDNLRLLCRAHNQYAADQAFGQHFMDKKRASRRRFSGAR
jgi:5-methylcytosine-specific restriction endonuclease McrA